jgi:hypothetical protein
MRPRLDYALTLGAPRIRSFWERRPLWALFAFLLFTPPPAGAVGTAVYLFVTLELFRMGGSGAAALRVNPWRAPGNGERGVPPRCDRIPESELAALARG